MRVQSVVLWPVWGARAPQLPGCQSGVLVSLAAWCQSDVLVQSVLLGQSVMLLPPAVWFGLWC